MAEGNGLLNRHTVYPVSWVRIPPSPPHLPDRCRALDEPERAPRRGQAQSSRRAAPGRAQTAATCLPRPSGSTSSARVRCRGALPGGAGARRRARRQPASARRHRHAARPVRRGRGPFPQGGRGAARHRHRPSQPGQGAGARPAVPDAAAAAFEQALALQPDFAEAHKDLGVMLMAQGRFKEASARFARALELVPELAENFADTAATLLKVNPALGEGVARAAAAWPKLVPANELLGAAGLAAIADDAMLLGVLKTTPVRDMALEWFLTSVRAACSSGRRCARLTRTRACWDSAVRWRANASTTNTFSTEAATSSDLVERQKQTAIDARRSEGALPPLRIAAVAAIARCLAGATGCWSAPGPTPWRVSDPADPRGRGAGVARTIPRLTPIASGTSQRCGGNTRKTLIRAGLCRLCGPHPAPLDSIQSRFPAVPFSVAAPAPIFWLPAAAPASIR